MNNTEAKKLNKQRLVGTKFHNSWRSIKFTEKGKKIGNVSKWNFFEGFKEDMEDSYQEGKILSRKNKSLPFSKENCIWINKGEENDHKLKTLEYNGEVKTLVEWCNLLDLNYNGVRQRAFKGKNYTNHEILFGYIKKKQKEIKDFREINSSERRNKASKMISSYKCNDLKKGLTCDLDIDWFIENIFNKDCSYCDSKINIGADRLNDKLGHIKENIVPCCYRCNIMKNNFFTFDEMRKIGQFIKNNIV